MLRYSGTFQCADKFLLVVLIRLPNYCCQECDVDEYVGPRLLAQKQEFRHACIEGLRMFCLPQTGGWPPELPCVPCIFWNAV